MGDVRTPMTFRFPQALVMALRARAEADGVSLNVTAVNALFRGLDAADGAESLEEWREGAERRLSRLEELAGL